MDSDSKEIFKFHDMTKHGNLLRSYDLSEVNTTVVLQKLLDNKLATVVPAT